MVIEQNKLADEVRRIAEAIRKVMAVDDDLEDADAERLHEILVGCVTAVNARLRHCDDLMRKGLRQEALHECERAPNVLDLVAELDIAEWDAWSDYVKQFGLAPQPNLLLNVAADLNAAYVQAQSLDDVMRLYRMHALARSPLSQRLAVLRNIASRDADNHAWQSDVRTFEAARVREMGVEFAQHATKEDFRSIANLKREIEGAEWASPLPAPFVKKVVDEHNRLIIKRSRQNLADLVHVIDSAFSQFDQNAAWQARSQWEQLAEAAKLADDDELAIRVAPAFQWLDELRDEVDRKGAFEASVGQLESALDDDGVSRAELCRLYATAERFDEAISPRLMRRFEERLRALDLAARRRTRLLMALTGTAILLLGAATLWAVNRQMKAREIDRVQLTLAGYIERGEYSQAREFYDAAVKDAGYVAEATDVKSLIVDLEAREKDDEQRQIRFGAGIAKAGELAKESSWTAMTQAKKELELAAKDARSEAEKTQLAEVTRHVKAKEAQLQDSEDSKFTAEFTPIAQQMAALDSLDLAQVESLLVGANEVRNRYRNRVRAETLQASAVDVCIRKLNDRLQSLRLRREEGVSVAKLREAVGSGPSFALALKIYLRLKTPKPDDAEIEQTLKDIESQLSDISDWNSVASRWNSTSLVEEASEPDGLKVISILEKKYAGFPRVADVLTRKAYLKSVAARNVDSDDAPMRKINEILNNRWFDMLSVETTSGIVFYLEDQPQEIQKGYYSFATLKDRHGPESATMMIKADEIKARADGQRYGASPHRQFSERAIKWLNESTKKSYEERMCNIIIMLQEQPGVDPILRRYLLQTIDQIAASGSTVLTDGLKAFRDAIRTDVTLSEQNWIGNDKETNSLRNKIADDLRRLPADISPKITMTEVILPQLKRTLASPRLPIVRWVGVIAPGDDGKLACLSRLELLQNLRGPLVVYDPKTSPASPFINVGAIENNKAVLSSSSSAVHEGQLAFAFVEK